MADRFKPCSVTGCNGNADVYARGSKGYCCKHYARFLRHGDPLAGRKRNDSPCSLAGCDDVAVSKGYCHKHYLRFWRHGDPLRVVQQHVQHGMSDSRIYHIWRGMLQRCGHWRGANAQGIKNYRDKGIRVCPEWQEFTVFAEWALSRGYSDNMSIDRIDSDLGYGPGNCRWLTSRDNSRARKNTKLSLQAARDIRRLRGEGMAAEDLAHRYGVTASLVYQVIAGEKWAE